MSGNGAGLSRDRGWGEWNDADPDEVDAVLAVLASYPHVARCAPCLDYALRHRCELSDGPLVSATVAHHATDHLRDVLTLASEHFA